MMPARSVVAPLVLITAAYCRLAAGHQAGRPRGAEAGTEGGDVAGPDCHRPLGGLHRGPGPARDRLLTLDVKEGQKVAAGEALVHLESYNVRLADVESAKAQVEKARRSIPLIEAELDHARSTFKRIMALQGDKVVSAQQYDDQAFAVKAQELALDKARAELHVAEAQQRAAEENLKLTILRAPAPGQVLKILTYPGEQVGTRPILQMGDTSRMYVVTEVHETDLPLVRVGQPAVVTSPALAGSLAGIVEEIGWLVNKRSVLDLDPRADVDTRVVEVRVRLADPAAVAALCNLKVNVRIGLEGAAPR